jgi:hypothetical protein
MIQVLQIVHKQLQIQMLLRVIKVVVVVNESKYSFTGIETDEPVCLTNKNKKKLMYEWRCSVFFLLFSLSYLFLHSSSLLISSEGKV